MEVSGLEKLFFRLCSGTPQEPGFLTLVPGSRPVAAVRRDSWRAYHTAVPRRGKCPHLLLGEVGREAVVRAGKGRERQNNVLEAALFCSVPASD